MTRVANAAVAGAFAALAAAAPPLRGAEPARSPTAAAASAAPSAIVSPRDAASGLPTGKRMHKPFVLTKENAASGRIELEGGRVFVLDTESGQVRFGDGVNGARPPDGAYPKKGGGTVVVKNGALVRAGAGAAGNVPPARTPTRVKR